VQLARDPREGAKFLWSCADDDSWRQVCVFFASADHDFVDGFLTGLVGRSPEIAGYCLSAAVKVTTPVALHVIERLRDDAYYSSSRVGDPSLAALMAATHAPRDEVRTEAVKALRAALRPLIRHTEHLAELFDADSEGLVRLLESLADTGAPEIVAMVPTLTSMVPDSEVRIVGPLWSCLAVPGVAEHGETAALLVRKLLRMATDPICFDELQSQSGYRPAFDNEDLRARAYPFNRGIDRDSNLVTLLVWASHLGVNFEPNPPNRFVGASAHPTELATVEKNHFRRGTTVQPYKFIMPVSTGGTLSAFVACVWIIFAKGSAGFEVAHLGWWSVFFLTGPSIIGLSVFYIIDTHSVNLSSTDADDVANYFIRQLRHAPNSTPVSLVLILLSIIPTTFALALAPLCSDIGGIRIYTPTIVVVQVLLYWLTFGTWCAKDRQVRIRKATPFEDIYDDPRSRHWLGVATPI
jgi:hypothetical protein